MKIAIVAPLVTPLAQSQEGGSQSMVVDLAEGLVRRGHEVAVIAASGSEIDGVDLHQIDVDAEAMRRALFRPNQGALRPGGSGLEKAFDEAFALAASLRCDVVHSHGFDPEALDASVSHLEDVIHTLHLPFDQPMGDAIRRAKAAGRVTALAVSHSQAAGWGALIDGVIPNGVPTARIPWSIDPQGYALCAGRISPEKGVIEAIEISRGAGLPLIVAGPDYDPSYARAARAVAGSDVNFIGSVDRTMLWSLMSRASVSIAAIKWDEPFGLAVAEAQAAGCPVIAWDAGAMKEVISDGVSGVLSPPGQIDEAVSAVKSCLSLDRAAVRRSAEERLDVESMCDGYARIYAAHMQRRQASRT